MLISAIVLAAGESRRMGDENKLLLPFRGKTVIEYTIQAVTESMAHECIVVVGHEADEITGALSNLDVQVVLNEAYRSGMSTSIHAGINAANQTSIGYMICLSDMPLILPTEYNALISAYLEIYKIDRKAIVVPRHQNQRGNPVIISSTYTSDILALTGGIGCREIIKHNTDHVFFHDLQLDHVLRDIDTPESYMSLLNG